MPTAFQILTKLLEGSDYDSAAEDFYERVREETNGIVNEFLKTGGAGRISWQLIKAEPVTRIWLEYGLHDAISDTDGLATIAEQMLALVARFYACTVLCGHTPEDPWPEIEENFGREFPEKEREALLGMIENDEGDIMSDYGLNPLVALWRRLYNASESKDQLLILDRMFNVVHQRGDLAAHFIQGGAHTLDKILDQGGYSTFAKEENRWGAQAKAQRAYAQRNSSY